MATTLLSKFASIQYDAVGSMLSVTSTIPTMTRYAGTTTYVYDAKNEFTAEHYSAVGGYTDSYQL